MEAAYPTCSEHSSSTCLSWELVQAGDHCSGPGLSVGDKWPFLHSPGERSCNHTGRGITISGKDRLSRMQLPQSSQSHPLMAEPGDDGRGWRCSPLGWWQGWWDRGASTSVRNTWGSHLRLSSSFGSFQQWQRCPDPAGKEQEQALKPAQLLAGLVLL